MPTSERDEGGRYKPEHSNAEVLDAVRTHSPAATSEVADELGIARQSADYRLRKLADANRIDHKKIGAAAVWSLPAEAER